VSLDKLPSMFLIVKLFLRGSCSSRLVRLICLLRPGPMGTSSFDSSSSSIWHVAAFSHFICAYHPSAVFDRLSSSCYVFLAIFFCTFCVARLSSLLSSLIASSLIHSLNHLHYLSHLYRWHHLYLRQPPELGRFATTSTDPSCLRLIDPALVVHL